MERLRPIQMLLPVHVKMTLLARVLILTECLWKFYMHHHFVYVKRTSIISSVTKGIRFLATTLRNHLHQATPKRSTYLCTFQINASVWGNFSEQQFRAGKGYFSVCTMNPDQHPNLIALSFAFYERDTKVELSVSLLWINFSGLILCWKNMHQTNMKTVMPTTWTTPKRSTFHYVEELVLPFEVISVCPFLSVVMFNRNPRWKCHWNYPNK